MITTTKSYFFYKLLILCFIFTLIFILIFNIIDNNHQQGYKKKGKPHSTKTQNELEKKKYPANLKTYKVAQIEPVAGPSKNQKLICTQDKHLQRRCFWI